MAELREIAQEIPIAFALFVFGAGGILVIGTVVVGQLAFRACRGVFKFAEKVATALGKGE